MSKGLTPTGKRILIRPDKAPDKVGRILLPEQAKQTPDEGVVFRVSRNIDHPINEGDRVIFGKFGGTEVQVGDETLKLVHQDDVLAIIG